MSSWSWLPENMDNTRVFARRLRWMCLAYPRTLPPGFRDCVRKKTAHSDVCELAFGALSRAKTLWLILYKEFEANMPVFWASLSKA